MGSEDFRPRRRADVQKLFEALEKEPEAKARSLTNSLGMKLVLVPAGTFSMGSPADHPAVRLNEMPEHEVILSEPFYLGVHLVTQEEYQRVVGVNPAKFLRTGGGGPKHPVESVSWFEAIAFCEKLGQLPEEKAQGRTYRLPTEAEWEYACRAGTTGSFFLGESLSSLQANFDGNYPGGEAAPGPFLGKTSPVGAYPANHFGLFDLHGNVWEWCQDWFDGPFYQNSPTRDPHGPEQGTYKVVRGGCWRSQSGTCRAAYRNALMPHHKDPYTGFRVVCVPTREKPANPFSKLI